MKERDIQKVIVSGFTVVKPEYENLRIKFWVYRNGIRRFYEKLGSRAALDSRLTELLKHPKNLEA